MINWLKSVYGIDDSASFGKAISTLAFICLVCINILIMINPYDVFKKFEFTKEINQYLFCLTIGGYSVSSVKEIVKSIFGKDS